ncbi:MULTISPECIES: ferritin-like domain-containing protein [Hymenobacter]|uniref:Ferritin-like domain-containing protein n=2 Tax=Hymenobacter TaxID=89966 RepID=A0ABS6WZI8_9BACT|nr:MULTISPECIES: ferritin-like domain-containing protein [Hymenobacter]MBO3272723.1 ferritin-like domain-containing protein [Hymenobacter defluvii]MBW3129012.1 ferritin-like domain-containing protein [Hymenobacter profundi]
MSNIIKPGEDEVGFTKPLYAPIKRRSFFMYAGATAGITALALAGCNDDSDNTSMPNMVDVGSSSLGVLNYAYALEQLEAGFYTSLREGTYYKGLASGTAEKQILDDLYYHEVIHREFFKAALGTNAIKALEPDFSAIDFNSRASVLGAAKTFEDLGVAAYNGAGRYIATDATGLQYLVIAGKIVSVEARHASLIRDLVLEGSFVDSDVVTIGTNGLEISKTPTEVVAAANQYLKEGSKLNVSNLV